MCPIHSKLAEQDRADRNPQKFLCNCTNDKETIKNTRKWAANMYNEPIENIVVGAPYPAKRSESNMVGLWIKH